jgi:dTMP kinase
VRAPLLGGLLVAIEGIDGAGKTTQAALLERFLKRRGLEVVRTKEPTTGPWGMKVRNSKFTARLSEAEELECFLADRREHVAQLINPALGRGAAVIVDRYYYSTVAYQGARGLDPQGLLALNRAFAPKPHLVALLDLEPTVGLARIHTRGLGQDLFEGLDALTKCRAIFNSLGEPHVATLDASLPEGEVFGELVFELSRREPFAAWAKT